ncbi:hypothetical protein R3P38DRAFT_3504657 [Favolaschia claudopus]|uniref:Uncharacterized protein n=1 Tax=Favolaschia claudopus TaxID=2862362 RepID=A0AAV9Z2F9_9AGAR
MWASPDMYMHTPPASQSRRQRRGQRSLHRGEEREHPTNPRPVSGHEESTTTAQDGARLSSSALCHISLSQEHKCRPLAMYTKIPDNVPPVDIAAASRRPSPPCMPSQHPNSTIQPLPSQPSRRRSSSGLCTDTRHAHASNALPSPSSSIGNLAAHAYTYAPDARPDPPPPLPPPSLPPYNTRPKLAMPPVTSYPQLTLTPPPPWMQNTPPSRRVVDPKRQNPAVSAPPPREAESTPMTMIIRTGMNEEEPSVLHILLHSPLPTLILAPTSTPHPIRPSPPPPTPVTQTLLWDEQAAIDRYPSVLHVHLAQALLTHFLHHQAQAQANLAPVKHDMCSFVPSSVPPSSLQQTFPNSITQSKEGRGGEFERRDARRTEGEGAEHSETMKKEENIDIEPPKGEEADPHRKQIEGHRPRRRDADAPSSDRGRVYAEEELAVHAGEIKKIAKGWRERDGVEEGDVEKKDMMSTRGGGGDARRASGEEVAADEAERSGRASTSFEAEAETEVCLYFGCEEVEDAGRRVEEIEIVGEEEVHIDIDVGVPVFAGTGAYGLAPLCPRLEIWIARAAWRSRQRS